MTISSKSHTTNLQADETNEQANLRPNAPWCPNTWHQTLSQIEHPTAMQEALFTALDEQKPANKQGWAILAKELAG